MSEYSIIFCSEPYGFPRALISFCCIAKISPIKSQVILKETSKLKRIDRFIIFNSVFFTDNNNKLKQKMTINTIGKCKRIKTKKGGDIDGKTKSIY